MNAMPLCLCERIVVRVLPMLVFAAMIAGLSVLNGCNIVGPAVVLAQGPPTIDAEHKLADRPTVVFVDDRRTVLGDRGIRRTIGDNVAEVLLSRGILNHERGHAISTADAMAVAGSEEVAHLKSLGAIAQEVGAEQIISIEMISFNMATIEGQPRAQAEFRVKVLDAVNRTRLFPAPDGPDARVMIAMLPVEQTFQPLLTRESAREAELTLAALVADKTAKLFYKHERGIELGGRSSPEANRRTR
ncbi:MAG: hypothetical protein ACR2GY_08325 [Phycisphaerales bacterium]